MKKFRIIALLLVVALIFVSCAPAVVEPADAEVIETPTEKQLIVYFANWYLESKPGDQGGEVATIPWDSVTRINHAFWKVDPLENPEQNSFDRSKAGEAARTAFALVSTNPEYDYEDDSPSAIDPSMPINHFAQYEKFSQQYPDVEIVISVGGWTACGFFSEMAYTLEGRTSFINSCMEVMDAYPWIDGIDLDWEHVGGSNDGERLPENETDQGCPIWGTAQEDRDNYASLCKEMREAFDAKYGEGEKLITACASASTGWTLPNQDWVSAEPYLDGINIMTYDLAGKWDGVTGHASNIGGVKGAFNYFTARDIAASKLAIGVPLYSMLYRFKDDIDTNKIVGAALDRDFAVLGSTITQKELGVFESEAVSGYTTKIEDGKVVMDQQFDNGGVGWHCLYDESACAAYMYNDDETSEYYKWYVSYDNALSLQAKIDFVNEVNAGGMMVWEVSQDTTDYAMVHQMAAGVLD